MYNLTGAAEVVVEVELVEVVLIVDEVVVVVLVGVEVVVVVLVLLLHDDNKIAVIINIIKEKTNKPLILDIILTPS
jgi:hypothetical protein